MCSRVLGKRYRSIVIRLLALVVAVCTQTSNPVHAQNLAYDGVKKGRVLQNPITVYMIYWYPPGVVADTSIYDGFGSFTTDVDLFFGDRVLAWDVPGVSNSSYLNILTQYPGSCGGPACVVANVRGAVRLGDSFVERLAYPHAGPGNDAGTQANPLADADIRDEIQRAISARNWHVDANTIVFVVTGVFQAGGTVEECRDGSNCTFKGSSFCGYHKSLDVNGVTIAYSYLSDANRAGCTEGITTALAGHTLSSDREIALLSHEFAEAITDPELLTAWYDSGGNEIGDKCNQIPSRVTFGGDTFYVQQEWSNATSSCVSSLPAVTSVAPTSGANTGGYQVTVKGGLFDTAGGTQFFFNGVPAPSVTCTSAASCLVTVPDSHGESGTIPVTASVGGFQSDNQPPGSSFTYDAPPSCTTRKSCEGHPWGFPDLVVQCATPVNFFDSAGTPSQRFVASGSSYTFPVGHYYEHKVAACLPGGSCAYFEAFETLQNFCGAEPWQSPQYCSDCQRVGGYCITLPTGRKICSHRTPMLPPNP